MDTPASAQMVPDDDGPDLFDLLLPLAQHWKLVLLGPLLVGLVALGISFLMPKTYLSRTVFVPPQQQQSAVAAAISQLGALSGLAGGAGSLKTPADQYLALMQSATISDRLIDAFDLMKIYGVEYRFKAREVLLRNVHITLGKRDGLITVEVEDRSAQRAAEMANRYVDELRALTGRLALSEAQQRRVLFETQLKQTRDRLTKAQQDLQASGFSQEALKTDARVSAENYARLRAEAASAEVRLQALRRGLSDNTPEVQQALSTAGSLRAQLAKLSESSDLAGAPDYVSKYREFKYQEALFDLLARQYEMARMDEAREDALVQIVDEAKPAEYKHGPRRALIALGVTLATLALLVAFLIVRHAWRNIAQRPQNATKIAKLRSAWRRG